MSKILIAYNNDCETMLHDFFESCADEAKQICTDNNIVFSSAYPPRLNEQSVVGEMQNHCFCFFAAHGDADGIYNENYEDVVSVRTTNYNFKDKGFYSIACHCAQNLHPRLRMIGLRLFVGYNDNFHVRGDHTPFISSAMAGLKSFLRGDTVKMAKEKMVEEFDSQIELLDTTDPMAAIELMHNKEHLVFEGNDDLRFYDL